MLHLWVYVECWTLEAGSALGPPSSLPFYLLVTTCGCGGWDGAPRVACLSCPPAHTSTTRTGMGRSPCSGSRGRGWGGRPHRWNSYFRGGPRRSGYPNTPQKLSVHDPRLERIGAPGRFRLSLLGRPRGSQAARGRAGRAPLAAAPRPPQEPPGQGTGSPEIIFAVIRFPPLGFLILAFSRRCSIPLGGTCWKFR